jgi:TonB family protein
LVERPELTGKIVLMFAIGPDGKVPKAAVDSTTLEDAEVERCMVETVKKLRFPRPKGGSVKVTYPFVFRPAG